MTSLGEYVIVEIWRGEAELRVYVGWIFIVRELVVGSMSSQVSLSSGIYIHIHILIVYIFIELYVCVYVVYPNIQAAHSIFSNSETAKLGQVSINFEIRLTRFLFVQNINSA